MVADTRWREMVEAAARAQALRFWERTYGRGDLMAERIAGETWKEFCDGTDAALRAALWKLRENRQERFISTDDIDALLSESDGGGDESVIKMKKRRSRHKEAWR